MPRCAGVTAALHWLCGANTPWKRVRWMSGGGTRAASRANPSTVTRTTADSETTCVLGCGDIGGSSSDTADEDQKPDEAGKEKSCFNLRADQALYREHGTTTCQQIGAWATLHYP